MRVVRLILHGELRRFSPDGRKAVELDGAGRTVREALAALHVPLAETAAFIVNGEQCDATAVLAEGDTLEALPAISGGEGAGGSCEDANRAVASTTSPRARPSRDGAI